MATKTRVQNFDNNCFAPASKNVIREVARWMARRDAEGGEQLLERFRARLHATEGLGGGGPYRIVFTSGRAEGNCQILTTAARAYAAKTNRLPHIITSAVEHPSILACCRQLVRDGLAQVSYLPVESAGGAQGPSALGGSRRPSAPTRAWCR